MRRRFSEKPRSRSPRRFSENRPAEVLGASALLEAAQRAREQEELALRAREQMNMPICQHFLQNACRFGDACTKIHPGGAEVRMRSAGSSPVCAHYLQGRCAYGAGCNKIHLGADEARQRCLDISTGAMAPAAYGTPAPYGTGHVDVSSTSAAVAPAPRTYHELLGKRIRGVLKSIKATPDTGLIFCPEVIQMLARDVIALAGDINNLCEGHEVSFELVMNDQGLPQAKNVVPETFMPGRIQSLDKDSGYGFIACPKVFEAFNRDVLVHEDLTRGLEVGQDVLFTFVLKDKRKQPQAKAVKAAKSQA